MLTDDLLKSGKPIYFINHIWRRQSQSQSQVQTLFRTDTCKVTYSVQGSVAKNRTLSGGTSSYRPYKGVPHGRQVNDCNICNLTSMGRHALRVHNSTRLNTNCNNIIISSQRADMLHKSICNKVSFGQG